MTIQVLVFGAAADAAGADRVSVADEAASAGATTVSRVLMLLAEQHAALRFALSGARLAVNRSFAPPDAPVRSGDEVALISLVGGG